MAWESLFAAHCGERAVVGDDRCVGDFCGEVAEAEDVCKRVVLAQARCAEERDGDGVRDAWHGLDETMPGEYQGRGSLVGCCLWGRTESDTTEAT